MRGGCFCSAVAYEVAGPVGVISHCHCSSCRRASGAAFVTWSSVPKNQLSIEGEEQVRWYRSPNARWGFCQTCGSTLFYEADARAPSEGSEVNTVYFTVATLVDELPKGPSCHVSYEEHVRWLAVPDGLPRYRVKSEERIPNEATHVILYVEDQQASAALYERVLLREPRLNVPGMTEFLLDDGAVLGLMPRAGIQRLLPALSCGQGSCVEVYLHLEGQVSEALARLVEAGGVELSGAQERGWGEVVAYGFDLDGHVLAFAGALTVV